MSLAVAIYSLFENEVQIELISQQERLSQLLDRLFRRPQSRFAVDISFDELPEDAIAPLLNSMDGRACISRRAALLLDIYVSHEGESLGDVRGVEFLAAYPVNGQPMILSPVRIGKSWIDGAVLTDGQLVEHLLAAGIHDEGTYLSKENRLTPVLRVAAARARYLQLIGKAPTAVDVLDHLAACPPWLTSLRLRDLPLTVRQANVLRAHSLVTVGELARFGNVGLLKLPNLGLKSVRELGETIYDALMTAPAGSTPGPSANIETSTYSSMSVDAPVANGSFLEMLTAELNRFGGVAARVVLARWAVGTEHKTLQQLAEALGVTRERVRQIEAKAIEKLQDSSLWEEFHSRVEVLLEDRTSPLWIARLWLEDPWFGDDAGAEKLITTCIEHFLAPRLHVLLITEEPAVSALSTEQWARATSDCEVILGPHNEALDEERLRRLARAVLVERGAELRKTLIELMQGTDAAIESDQTSDSVHADDELTRQLERAILQHALAN